MPRTERYGGAVLAGGRSTRMGRDKAALPWKGGTLLDHARETLVRAGCATVLVCGGPQGLPDAFPDAGPVNAVSSIGRLREQECSLPENWLFIPVDMPLLMPEMLRDLAEAMNELDAARYASGPLPCCLRITPALTHTLEAALRVGVKLGMRHIVQAGACRMLSFAENERHFFNANTPQEWEILHERAY